MQWFNDAPEVVDGHWKCPDKSCGGEMVSNGAAWYSDPLGYHHVCTHCGTALAAKEAYPTSSLSRMAAYVGSVNPLSGPNVLRYSHQVFKDNGDGTMTMRRFPSYVRKTGE